ncbi:MAG: response regulator [Bacteroidales bacterium]|nr:response regulator [Bacteroidales bacterium]
MKDNNRLIIIADDDVDYLFQMEHYVKSFGFEVKVAHSQKEAELIIENTEPVLAIFDLMMERDDSGFILCHKMRRKHPNVPIILATAVASETGISFGVSTDEDKQWIKADLYLEKGIRKDQLHKEINKLLKL